MTKHSKHYSRFSSGGTQKRSGRRKRPANTPGDEGEGAAVSYNPTKEECLQAADRYWKFVQKSDTCWEWIGAPAKSGYGRFGLLRKTHYSHRISWIMYFEDPGDLCVLHKCDNRKCVRPDHLFLGTRKDNIHDCIRKGRNCYGESHPSSKLNKTIIRIANRLRSNHGWPFHRIAILWNVGRETMRRTLCGQRWKHLTH